MPGVHLFLSALKRDRNRYGNAFSGKSIKFVINAFLLWITDKLIDDFEIDGFGATLIAAFLIALVDSLLRWIF